MKTNLETKATGPQHQHHLELGELLKQSQMPTEELLISLGLFMRSSELAKVLFINELYELIKDVPGVIMEFGCWRGQNLALFENLRAIYEPFNATRKIIGFDTFKGYTGITVDDKVGNVIKQGNYKIESGYKEYLEKILDWHEKNNILGNIKKCEVIEGDVCKTVPEYFEQHPETIVALAYFDLSLYKPTQACFKEIWGDRTNKGSVIMLDEYGTEEGRGETKAFFEYLRPWDFEMHLSKYMPGRTIAVMT